MTKKEIRPELFCESIGPTPDNFNWQWKLYINGEPVEMKDINHVAIESKFGLINVGIEKQSGYNMISFRETGQGGSVTVPFLAINDHGQVVDDLFKATEIMVGVVLQNRPKMGSVVKNTPRGFIQLGETHQDTSERELFEETGIKGRTFELPGSPVNPNSAIFETGKGGIHFYALQLFGADLDTDGRLKIAEETALDEKIQEMISGFQFISMWEALTLPCGITVNSVARLMLWLKTANR